MRPIIPFLFAILSVSVGCGASAALPGAEAAWGTDLAAATSQATAGKRPILADFTGSDWCSWCMKLKKEVFDTAEFKTWAAAHVVLLEVDFPNEKPQSAALKQQNAALQEKYRIEGFPTIVLLKADGSKLGELGYQPGGPGPWIKAAEAILGGH